MPFSHEVNRITISGTSFGGEEQWSTGFYYGYASGDADVATEEWAAALGPLWQTFFTAASSFISTQWQTTEIKIARMGTDGKTVPDSPVYYTYPAPITGGGGAASAFPPQIALVATLVGPQARGLASKGRMYLPGVVASVNGNGRISDANRGTIATNIRAFLRGALDMPFTPNVPMLASQGRKAPLIGAPVMHEVVSVRVGNVYDTQRRRRNALAEAYSTAIL